MTGKNDGGPAFPRTQAGKGEDFDCGHEGMSLRDYFAAHAPPDPATWFVFEPATKRPSRVWVSQDRVSPEVWRLLESGSGPF